MKSIIIILFFLLVHVSLIFSKSPLVWGWSHFPRQHGNKPHSSIFTFNLTSGVQSQVYNSSMHVLSGTYDFDHGFLYVIEATTNELLQFDITTGNNKSLGAALPDGFQPPANGPAVELHFLSTTNTIYGYAWNGGDSNYVIFKIALDNVPVQPVSVSLNFPGGSPARNSRFSLDGNGNYIAGSALGEVLQTNVVTGESVVTNFTAANGSVVSLWWWDAPRNRMTAFIGGQYNEPAPGLQFIEVDMQDMSITQVIAEYPALQQSFKGITVYAYNPVYDLLFLKAEGIWHARSRNLTYVAISPSTGEVVSQFVLEKVKGGGDSWEYEGARITNDVVAFFSDELKIVK